MDFPGGIRAMILWKVAWWTFVSDKWAISSEATAPATRTYWPARMFSAFPASSENINDL